MELFEGPLDLLLYLIKKNHINIYDIPIATVLEQYLQYLDFMKMFDINIVSEYMVLAAQLIEIKSRMLLPQPQPEGEEEVEDPRQELAERLMEYKKYKEVAGLLKEKESERMKYIRRKDGLADFKPEERYFEASIFDLITAFKNALKDVPRELFYEVIKDEFTVEEKIHDILHMLLNKPRILLNSLFAVARNKLEIVATFLAILELIKIKEIQVLQTKLFGEIIIARYTINA